MATGLEVVGISGGCDYRCRDDNADTRDRHQPAAGVVLTGECNKVFVDGVQFLGDLLQLFHEMKQRPPGGHWKTAVGLITDHTNQETHMVGPLRTYDTEFSQVTPDPIDQLGSLTQQHLAHAVQHKYFLLLLLLYRNEAHGRSRHGLANCFRVRSVILVGFDVGPNILCRQQPYIMAKPTECPSPMMAARAGFQTNLTW
jgi:hypothetical protein